MDVTVRIARDALDFAICMAIRMEVFIREQGVKMEEEMDGLDEQAVHYLATADGAPAATARVRREGHMAKIERVAVRVPFREQGVGAVLMRTVINDIRAAHDVAEIRLGSQLQAMPFYEKLGFIGEGETYEDARIPHRMMVLSLAN